MTDQTEKYRIIEFRGENVLRLSVVQVTPEGNLIIISGANKQGKTSVMNLLWMALGGKNAEPEKPIHNGKHTARIEVKIGHGSDVKLIAERTFTDKGSYLTVKGPEGGKFASPQKILDGLMGAIGFDPLSFMDMDAKQQFALLRSLVKLEVDIEALDRRRGMLFEQRTGVNRDLASAKARAAAIVVPDLPDEAPDVDGLAAQLAEAGRHNTDIAGKLREIDNETARLRSMETSLEDLKRSIEVQETQTAEQRTRLDALLGGPPLLTINTDDLVTAITAAKPVLDGFAARDRKIDADAEVTTCERSASDLTDLIQVIDAQKLKALSTAKMPIDGLSFDNGAVIFNGEPLSQASGAEQLQVSLAIGAALNPQLPVLLCRDGSRLDKASRAQVAKFAEERGLQVFLELVDESGEVGIVIEDGHIKGQEKLVEEFRKEEAEREKAEEGKAPAADAKAAPDPARLAKAQAYVAAEIEKLPSYTKIKDADHANATVKHMLQAFPALIADHWKPAYDAAVALLKKND